MHNLGPVEVGHLGVDITNRLTMPDLYPKQESSSPVIQLVMEVVELVVKDTVVEVHVPKDLTR